VLLKEIFLRGSHGLALRSGLNALDTFNWIGALDLFKSSLSSIIKLSSTLFYKQIMIPAEKVRPN
jgi:hypothetical protein